MACNLGIDKCVCYNGDGRCPDWRPNEPAGVIENVPKSLIDKMFGPTVTVQKQIAAQHAQDRLAKWDRRFVKLAGYIAQEWSKDPSTQVGAVLVDPETCTVLGTGYNGFPRGVLDDPERYNDRPAKYARVVHAEVNAILTASKSARGATLYSSLAPCNECAKMIIQAGVKRVVAPPLTMSRWNESHQIAVEMFGEAGVAFDTISEEAQ